MQHKKLVLYAYTFRSRAERVIRLLNELDLEYVLIRVDPFDDEGNKNAELLKINPEGRVPALLYGDRVLTESLAIMEYLSKISCRQDLLPQTNDETYEFRQFMYFLATEIETYLWTADQSSRLNEFYCWPPGTTDNALRIARKNIQWLYQKIGDRDFVLGDRFTIADIYAHHLLAWASSYDFDYPEAVDEYKQKLEQRPAFQNI